MNKITPGGIVAVDPVPIKIELAQRDAEKLSHALADVLCWYAGFSAGNPDYSNPCDLNTLREFNIKLKDKMQ